MRKTAPIAALTLALAASALAAPANAGPPREQWLPYSGSDVFSACGYDGTTEFSGSTQILDTNPSLDGQFFRFTDRYSFTDTLTNSETGAYVTASGTGVFKEIQPVALGGGIFTFQGMDAGTFTVKDDSGKVVLRESGRILFTGTFDTLNDGEPGGDMLAFDLVRTSGPHATFDEDFDLCSFLDEQIG